PTRCCTTASGSSPASSPRTASGSSIPTSRPRCAPSSAAEAADAGSALHELRVDLDLDLVADEHPTGLERRVPLDPPVLAVDGGRRREPGAGVAPRVLADAVELELEVDGPGHTFDRELGVHHVVVAGRVEAGGDQPHR